MRPRRGFLCLQAAAERGSSMGGAVIGGCVLRARKKEKKSDVRTKAAILLTLCSHLFRHATTSQISSFPWAGHHHVRAPTSTTFSLAGNKSNVFNLFWVMVTFDLLLRRWTSSLLAPKRFTVAAAAALFAARDCFALQRDVDCGAAEVLTQNHTHRKCQRQAMYFL